MAQTLVDLLMGQQPGPYLPTAADAATQEDARRRELLNILAQPGQVPGLQPDVPRGIQILQTILGGLADARGAKAAVLGGMPSLQGNALEQLRQRRMQRDAAEYAVKQQSAKSEESAKKQAAAMELGMMDTAQERRLRKEEIKAKQDFEAQQAQLDREARAEAQRKQLEIEQRMAAENATLKRDLEERSNRTQVQIAEMKKKSEDKIDQVAQRAIDRENRKASAKVKQGIVGSMAAYGKMLEGALKGDPNGQTPDQIYEVVLNEIDANVDDPSVANDLRHFTLEKLGPMFQKFYDAQDASGKPQERGPGLFSQILGVYDEAYKRRHPEASK